MRLLCTAGPGSRCDDSWCKAGLAAAVDPPCTLPLHAVWEAAGGLQPWCALARDEHGLDSCSILTGPGRVSMHARELRSMLCAGSDSTAAVRTAVQGGHALQQPQSEPFREGVKDQGFGFRAWIQSPKTSLLH